MPDFAPIFAASDFLVQLRAAELGVGAIILSAKTGKRGDAGLLVPLPIELGRMRVGLHLVCARSALAVPRVRAVAALLADELVAGARVARGGQGAAPSTRRQ